MGEKTYTPAQVAELTGMTLTEIRRLMRSGDLAATDHGRRISQRQLAALTAAPSHTTSAPAANERA